MMKLSIIIPVYNAEKYLERCVKSCMSQGLAENEYEILLCNDGSTDNSLAIAEDFSQKYSCVKVYSQENAGAGMARNLGLKYATGDYVVFVDSDDYLIPNSIQGPLELCINNKLDICRYLLFNKVISDGRNWINTNPVTSHVIFTGCDLLSNRHVPLDTVCSALYRLCFLRDNNLAFSHLTSSEDVEFTLRVLLHAEHVMYDDTQVYVYEIKDDTRGHPKDPTQVIDFIKNDLSIASIIKKYQSFVPNDKFLTNNLITRSNSTTTSALLTLLRLRKIINKTAAREVIDYAKDLGVYPIKDKTFSWKTTLLVDFFINNRNLFLFVFKK